MNLWEAYDEIDEHLKGRLLTIPPYPSISGRKVAELLDSMRKPDPSSGGLEGETLRMIMNPWQRAYQIEYRFKPSKIFTEFMKVIESATYDLMIGNYISSYLSLVPTVEAIMRKWADEKYSEIDSFNHKGRFSIHKFGDNLVRYLNERNNERKPNSRFSKWIDNQIKYFNFIIREVFYLDFKKSEQGIQKEFNRNRTLHLLDIVNDQEVIRDNNTRILLLLDIIAELYLALDEELYTKNTFFSDPDNNLDFNLRWKIYLENSLNAINYTDMNIIRFAFLEKNTKSSLTNDQKTKFIKQKDFQIDFIRNNY